MLRTLSAGWASKLLQWIRARLQLTIKTHWPPFLQRDTPSSILGFWSVHNRDQFYRLLSENVQRFQFSMFSCDFLVKIHNISSSCMFFTAHHLSSPKQIDSCRGKWVKFGTLKAHVSVCEYSLRHHWTLYDAETTAPRCAEPKPWNSIRCMWGCLSYNECEE